ncbi:MAG: Processive diacylglycerol beta-glucosyltransferase [Firmicutes bacterium ADurb.Bin193]|nr:MAG: Processive diacylglycerol beta-glucosyltransferase [Firmicutes bacterium ADurb.Bin193]
MSELKVLVLTVTAGQGHHQTAMAISDYFSDRNVECRILDVIEYVDPAFKEIVSRGYLVSTKHIPLAYGGFYALAEKNEKNREKFMSRLASALMGRKLIKYLEDYKPDVVISTHVFAAQVITGIKQYNGLKIGIVTDFTIHPYWEETELDFYVTASELLTLQAEKKGISPDKILPIGIPIHKKFAEKISKSEARARLGIEDKTTILVMGGSMGYGNIAKHIKRMDKLNVDFQIICVCGTNARAKRSIDKIVTNRKIYNHGYVDNVDIMMDAADILVTKPGGLTVSEALAKCLPMILVNPIPGQEERNTEFLLNNGIAMKMTRTCPVDVCLYQMLMNNWRYNLSREVVKYMGKPHAAQKLGEFVINYAKDGTA